VNIENYNGNDVQWERRGLFETLLRHIPGDTVENVDNAHFEQAVICFGFEYNIFEYDARRTPVSPGGTFKNRQTVAN
jgi:hypothetical protein